MDVGDAPSITTSRSTTRIRFPTSKPVARQNDSELHGDSRSFGVVYANELANKSYAEKTLFPPGSIIVREKLSQPEASQPELLAVMIKREKGFNPAANDWLFLTVNGAGSEVKARKKKGQCLSCHQSAAERDFVFELK